MEEKNSIFENRMAELAAYLVEHYDMEPRDAAGLIMNSPLTQEIFLASNIDGGLPIEELAENYIR